MEKRELPESKHAIGVSVYDAAKDRVAKAFDLCTRVYVSFSAGKDSTVMLHLVAAEAIKRGRRFGVLLIDLEAQYSLTIEHAELIKEEYKDHSDWFWVCLPLSLRNAVSMYEPQWVCWDESQKSRWVREHPEHAITNPEAFPFFRHGMEFEDFVPDFGEWYSQGESTACFVGIRSDESLNRFRTIAKQNKERMDGLAYTTKVTENCFNFYPIYDWATEDIWVWHYKNPERRSNELYDVMHKAGLSIHMQRICQPYGDDQRRGLWLYHLIEPYTWGRVVARVSGANSGSLYIQESGNMTGYGKVTLPEGHTWRTFCDLLLLSLPEKTQHHFRAKIDVFRKWHMDRGYPEGIPDAVDTKLENKKLVPSWRRVCKAILRNDYWCKTLGFSQHKSGSYSNYLKMMKKRKERTEWNLEEREQLGCSRVQAALGL